MIVLSIIFCYLLGKDSPPPPPPDVAHGELMSKLGLLLDNKSNTLSPEQGAQVSRLLNQHREEQYGSLYSRPGDEKGISNSSPMSTLTGEWFWAKLALFKSL